MCELYRKYKETIEENTVALDKSVRMMQFMQPERDVKREVIISFKEPITF